MTDIFIIIFTVISALNLLIVINIYKLIVKLEREQYRLCGAVLNIQKDRFQQMIKTNKIKRF